MQESGEMYLESILVLSQKDAPVRSLDVARYLNVSKPSVSRAMAILKQVTMWRSTAVVISRSWNQGGRSQRRSTRGT